MWLNGGLTQAKDNSIRNRLVRDAAIAVALIGAVFVVYGPSLRFGFTNFDDDLYVTKNAQVQQGLTFRGVAWAFTTGHASNWHPATWLSHMLDCEMSGVRAGPHRFTNLFLHAVNSVLVYLL